MAQCTRCEQVYAAYYTHGGDLVTPSGKRCPNCGNDQFFDLGASDT